MDAPSETPSGRRSHPSAASRSPRSKAEYRRRTARRRATDAAETGPPGWPQLVGLLLGEARPDDTVIVGRLDAGDHPGNVGGAIALETGAGADIGQQLGAVGGLCGSPLCLVDHRNVRSAARRGRDCNRILWNQCRSAHTPPRGRSATSVMALRSALRRNAMNRLLLGARLSQTANTMKRRGSSSLCSRWQTGTRPRDGTCRRDGASGWCSVAAILGPSVELLKERHRRAESAGTLTHGVHRSSEDFCTSGPSAPWPSVERLNGMVARREFS